MIREAEFSPCGAYRYTLRRQWAPGPTVCWVLLNPSTADAEHDDRTNRRGINFSKAWGYGGCVFVNLFAWRSPYPKVMKKQLEPVGPENDTFIVGEALDADRVVIAWGNDGMHRARDLQVLGLLRDAGVKCFHLGTATMQGAPRHPLYLPKTTTLEEW